MAMLEFAVVYFMLIVSRLKENENHELGTGFFVHKIIISAAKKV
jgi:hypothetical protein